MATVEGNNNSETLDARDGVINGGDTSTAAAATTRSSATAATTTSSAATIESTGGIGQ